MSNVRASGTKLVKQYLIIICVFVSSRSEATRPVGRNKCKENILELVLPSKHLEPLSTGKCDN